MPARAWEFDSPRGHHNRTTNSQPKEHSAYWLDRVLGLSIVPIAIIRQGHKLTNTIHPRLMGSQVANIGMRPYNPLSIIEMPSKFFIADLLLANGDRNDTNSLIAADGRIIAIDHGLIGTTDEWESITSWKPDAKPPVHLQRLFQEVTADDFISEYSKQGDTSWIDYMRNRYTVLQNHFKPQQLSPLPVRPLKKEDRLRYRDLQHVVIDFYRTNQTAIGIKNWQSLKEQLQQNPYLKKHNLLPLFEEPLKLAVSSCQDIVAAAGFSVANRQ